MADCEQPTRTLTKLRFRQFQRFILTRPTVGAQIRHGNPPFLRLTAEFERSEKPATSSLLGPVDKPRPDADASEQDESHEAGGELIISGGDAALLLEMPNEAVNP